MYPLIGQKAARQVIKYPPNPLATTFVKLKVSGRAVYMTYNDGDTEKCKEWKSEVLVPLRCFIIVWKFSPSKKYDSFHDNN